MSEFQKIHEQNNKLNETVHLINKELNEIPILIGNYGVYCYFKNFINVLDFYKEKDFFSKIELLISKSSFPSIKDTLTSNGYKFIKDSWFQKEDILYQFDILEEYNIDIEKANVRKSYPSFSIEEDKVILKPKDNTWKYYIPNFESFKKMYQKRKDKKMLEKLDTLWKKSLERKEKERSHLYFSSEDRNKDIEELEYLEIVSDFASLGGIKKVFPSHLKLMMPLALHIGDIKDIYEGKRKWLSENNADYEIEKCFQELHRLLSKVKKVRIWSSKVCADEFLMFCFLCDYIKEKDIYVTFSDDFLEETWSIGCMTKEEIASLSLKEHHLSKKEIEHYKKIWKKAYEENREIRYMKKKEIHSVSFDYFTDLILEIVSKLEEISVCSLIGALMGERLIENFGSFEYSYMLKRQIDLGKLEVVDDGKELDNVKYFGDDSFSYSLVKVKSI